MNLVNTLECDCGSANIICKDQCAWEQEKEGLLQTVFKDGLLVKTTTLNEIRELLNNQIN